jgi:hypothetical protein
MHLLATARSTHAKQRTTRQFPQALLCCFPRATVPGCVASQEQQYPAVLLPKSNSTRLCCFPRATVPGICCVASQEQQYPAFHCGCTAICTTACSCECALLAACLKNYNVVLQTLLSGAVCTLQLCYSNTTNEPAAAAACKLKRMAHAQHAHSLMLAAHPNSNSSVEGTPQAAACGAQAGTAASLHAYAAYAQAIPCEPGARLTACKPAYS